MPIISLINVAFEVYTWLLIARIIFSWIPLPANETLKAIMQLVYEVTEPFLRLFRRILPIADLGGMGIDFSPIIAFIVLRLIKSLVIGILSQFLL